MAATHKVSTLQRRLAAISQAHQVAEFESPTGGPVIRNLLAGIRRSKTDPEGHGRKIGIPLGSGRTCAVKALGK
jgi:hypothetical protein